MGSVWSGIKQAIDAVFTQLQAVLCALDSQPSPPPHIDFQEDEHQPYVAGNPFAGLGAGPKPDAICEHRQAVLVNGQHMPELDKVQIQVQGPGDFVGEINIKGLVMNGSGQLVDSVSQAPLCSDCWAEVCAQMRNRPLTPKQARVAWYGCLCTPGQAIRHGNGYLCYEHARRRGLALPSQSQHAIHAPKRVTNLITTNRTN